MNVWINAVAATAEQRDAATRSAWAYPREDGTFLVRDFDVPGADRTPILAVPEAMAPENLGAVE